MKNEPVILLVMHKVPVASGFLKDKFIALSVKCDVRLLVWDEKKVIEDFAKRYRQNSKIYNGIHKRLQAITAIPNLIRVLLCQRSLRTYLLHGDERWMKKIKLLYKYLPIFRIRPDIIHFEFGTLATDITSLSELLDAKMVVSFRGYDINYIGLDNPEYYLPVWNLAHALHFLGEDLKRRAIKRGYNGRCKEAIIPPAVDTAFFTAVHNKVSDKFMIVSTGRLTWKKGFEYAIQACARLKEAKVPFEYHIVGEGPHRQAIEYTIHEHGLEKEVILHGQLAKENVRDILAASDLFLHPAISEGFCNAVLEAQSMSLPVICTDADGLPENVIDGETGFVVPKWNVQAMFEKMLLCHNNNDLLASMGIAGAKRVREYFSIEKQIDAFMTLYNSVHAE